MWLYGYFLFLFYSTLMRSSPRLVERDFHVYISLSVSCGDFYGDWGLREL